MTVMAYRITGWRERYEFTRDKRDATSATPDSKLRQKPHTFIKWKVFGHKLGHKYRLMVKKAWKPGEINELAVLGFFGKLLELAGDQTDPRHRGWILDEDQQSMDVAAIAELLDIHEKSRLTETMGLLIDLGWVEKCELPCEIVEKTGGLQKLQPVAKIATACNPLIKACNPLITETEGKENLNETEGKPAGAGSGFCAPKLSDSDISARSTETLNELFRIFHITHGQTSDITTLKDIVRQVTEHISQGRLGIGQLSFMLQEANASYDRDVKNPIGRFVAKMKQAPFNYVPEERSRGGSILSNLMKNFGKS